MMQSVRSSPNHEVFQPTGRLAYDSLSSFFAGDFKKWKALPVNQVKGLQSGISYL